MLWNRPLSNVSRKRGTPGTSIDTLNASISVDFLDFGNISIWSPFSGFKVAELKLSGGIGNELGSSFLIYSSFLFTHSSVVYSVFTGGLLEYFSAI
jgi:hypothetical protein